MYLEKYLGLVKLLGRQRKTPNNLLIDEEDGT
jgi:hypothetical protein